jgi:hypothetical protein
VSHQTTVVGPLLTLILADGKQLVTQVMPTALLEQTRTIMRGRFSQVRHNPSSVFLPPPGLAGMNMTHHLPSSPASAKIRCW